MKLSVHLSRLCILIMSLLAGLVMNRCVADANEVPAAGLVPIALRCEYEVDPLGIQEIQPRLSWQLTAAQRGARQTACEILVASSPELLQQDKGDLWDTGRRENDESIGTVYAGTPLVAQEHCFWKVRVWDAQNHAAWSQPAEWSMGLLNPADWRAQWIGYDAARRQSQSVSPFEHARWIWLAADGDNPPKGFRRFSRDFSLPAGVEITGAELSVAADDAMQIAINGQVVLASDSWKIPQRADVTKELHPGVNHLLVQAENAEAGPAGLLASLVVTKEDGQTIRLVTDGSWRAALSPGTNWLSQSLAGDAWSTTRVIGEYGAAPWGLLKTGELFLPPAPYFRTAFRADRPV